MFDMNNRFWSAVTLLVWNLLNMALTSWQRIQHDSVQSITYHTVHVIRLYLNT